MGISGLIISDWTLSEGEGDLPEDGFLRGGGLLLEPRRGSDLFTLVWLDADANPCWIQGIPLDETVHTEVHFGSGSIPCEVKVWLTGTSVKGDLKELTARSGGDGNAGTFTADASGPPPPVPSGE